MADKKISELPKINAISGSTVILPIVHDGTTQRMDVSTFAVYASQWSADTGSNTFFGNQIISGNLTLTGNSVIGGNVEVGGMITAQQYNVTYVSSSVQYKSGSTEFGDSIDDTHTITGTIILNGLAIGTAELMAHTASQIGKDGTLAEVTSSLRYFYQTTSSLHAFTASQIGKDETLKEVTSSLRFFYQTTSSLHAFTASQIGKDETLKVVTSSLNAFTASQLGQANTIAIFTSSINSFTGSVIGQSNTIATFTSSVNFTTQSLNNQTGSQNSLNTSLGLITSSIYGEITSFNNVFSGVSNVTGAFAVEFGSIQKHILSQAVQTSSQDLVNLGISSVTGSLIGITNTLMGFTASLDNTYATDAQLYQLYQATASIQFTTRSLNLQTGSQDLVNLGISTYTGSQNVINTSVNAHILKQATQTGSQDLVNLGISSVTGSLIGITNGLMAFTAALDSTYATDAQLYQLYQATSSIQFATASLNVQTGSQNSINFNISVVTSSIDAHILKQAIQTGSQDLVNLGISSVTGSLIGITNGLMAFTAALDSTYATDAQLYQLYAETASIKAEIAGIEALTASFKAASIVSSSTQIQNYNVFAQTASANVFFGKQSVSGALHVANGITGSFLGNLNGTANFSTYTSNIALLKDNTDTTLYPVFSSNVAADSYASLKGHASGTLYYNGLTQQLIVSGGGLVVTGSVNVTGSITITSGSITMPHRPAFRIVGTGGEVIAPYILSGSKVSVDYNQGNHFNTTNGLFTAPIAGLYQVNLVIRTNSNTNSTINQAIVYKQSSAIDTAQIMVEFAANTTMNHSGGSTITKLEAGDTLRAQVVVGTCSFDGNNNFSVAYIG